MRTNRASAAFLPQMRAHSLEEKNIIEARAHFSGNSG
jgi:hypothetical protein